MLQTNTVNTAATVLGLPENVITNFLHLVNSLENHSADNSHTPFLYTHKSMVDLDDLANEYAKKL